MRIALIVLAVIQLLIAVVIGLTGGFADGTQWWQRAIVMAVHPVAAIALLVLVFTPRPAVGLTGLVMALLAVNIAADAFHFYAILSGMVKGDWWLALIFSVIPLIGLVYGATLLGGKK